VAGRTGSGRVSCWILALGPGRGTGRIHGRARHQVLGYLAGSARAPGPCPAPGPGAFRRGSGSGCPRQAPASRLILAPAEALGPRGWLRGRRAGDPGLNRRPRPGLIVAVRRQFIGAQVRSGGGGSAGPAPAWGVDRGGRAGRRDQLAGRRRGGVLVHGQGGRAGGVRGQFPAGPRGDPPPQAGPWSWTLRGARRGLPGATRRDLRGRRRPAARLRAGRPGAGYEPLRGGDTGPRQGRPLGHGDDRLGPGGRSRPADVRRLPERDLFAVGGRSNRGDPRIPVLDDVAALLAPGRGCGPG